MYELGWFAFGVVVGGGISTVIALRYTSQLQKEALALFKQAQSECKEARELVVRATAAINGD